MSYQERMIDKEGSEVLDLNNYKHIYKGKLEVSDFWLPYILIMLDEIDKITTIKWLPQCISNWVNKILERNQIHNIYTNFGTLKINGLFNTEVYEITKEARDFCNNICELCGDKDATKSTIKGWVYNCCENCK